jgi:pyridoxal phosphate enzyme (YggS family)
MQAERVAANVERVREEIAAACARAGRPADEVTLISVTKGFGADTVRAAVSAGIGDIGENRVQEALAKQTGLEDLDLTWHLVGHLQTNKVKAALAHFAIIHSVDSVHLAEAIAARAPAEAPVFVEVNIAAEPSKSGFLLDELPSALEAIRSLPRLDVRGLMTVAPITRRPEDVRPVFAMLRREAERAGLVGLSMGMSDDFAVAVEEGATHVRIGRALFGERPA